MKKFYALFVLALFTTAVQAQDTISVIFAVDASAITVTSDTIGIAGDWQDNSNVGCGDWTPSCDGSVLLDADEDGVYTVKVKILRGTYAYKYINGTAWGDNEGLTGTNLTGDCSVTDGGGNINRTLDLSNAPVGKDTVVGPYLYDDCAFSATRVTGIDREFAGNLGMSIAPNPANSNATLTFANERGQSYTMTLTTMTGAVVRREAVTTSTVEIQRNDLPAGLYFVTLVNGEGQRASKKMIFR